jgi:lipopolysaccharide biosynthesis glycosyltransferase
MNSQETSLICTGIDDGYVWPWMVSIYSASVHSEKQLEVGLGVIKGRFSKANLELIKKFCDLLEIKLLYREFDFNFDVQLDRRIPVQAYIRILWMDTLDRKFLWLDSDTLCLENWDHIFEYCEDSDQTAIIYAIPDVHINNRGLINFPSNKALQVSGGTYFNSGIFIGDPIQWQNLEYPKAWKRLAENYKDFGFTMHDQDILNFLLFEKKKLIPSSYNCIVSAPSQIYQRILHFAGGPKPWDLDPKSQRYFTALETLKDWNSTEGAFSGKNWIFEFENYWRHEKSLLKRFNAEGELMLTLLALRDSMRKPLRKNIDNIKIVLLNFVGRKWF